MQNQSNSLITFDTQLKTAVKILYGHGFAFNIACMERYTFGEARQPRISENCRSVSG